MTDLATISDLLLQELNAKDNLPPKFCGVLQEFQRLSADAAAFLSIGDLFPALSSLTALGPVVGILQAHCVENVVPREQDSNQGNTAIGIEFENPGLYL